jgi:hypothetical protein
VTTKTSLELIPRDGVDVRMGVVVDLPPVGYHSIELMRSKKAWESVVEKVWMNSPSLD